MRKQIAFGLAAFLLSCGTALAQDAAPSAPPADPAKLAVAMKILDETHAQTNMMALLDLFTPQIVAAFKRDNPSVPDDTVKSVGQMLKEEMGSSIPDVLKLQAQVYCNHFSLDELNGLEKFYESDLGQKMIAETPAIAKETVPIGMAWGRQAGERALARVIEKLRAQGVKI